MVPISLTFGIGIHICDTYYIIYYIVAKLASFPHVHMGMPLSLTGLDVIKINACSIL